MNNESTTAEYSFYRYSKYVWNAARQVFEDYQKDLVLQCSMLDQLVVSFDMGWQKRYGFSSSLGMLYSFFLLLHVA